MRYLLLAIALAGAYLLTGCAYVGNAESPHATASISDTCTSATLGMGAIGEFTLIATHARLADGGTTGTVVIVGKKDTMNNVLTGAISAAAGLLVGKGM